MANKPSGSPRFVLVIRQVDQSGRETTLVTSSESNSKNEFYRLKRLAKKFFIEHNLDPFKDSVRIYLVMEPEMLSQASLITDIEIHQWIENKTKKTEVLPIQENA